MSYERLEKNLIDNITEAQIKLGYDGRPMSLNYTVQSLRHLTDREDVEKALDEFAEEVSPRLGKLTFHGIRDGFCITVPAEGTAYVHEKQEADSFICTFIEAIRSHTTLENVLGVFRKYSDDVSVTEMENEEFQYLVYFRNGIPDDYRYCLSVEEEIDGSHHITYHRFIAEDYEELGF